MVLWIIWIKLSKFGPFLGEWTVVLSTSYSFAVYIHLIAVYMIQLGSEVSKLVFRCYLVP